MELPPSESTRLRSAFAHGRLAPIGDRPTEPPDFSEAIRLFRRYAKCRAKEAPDDENWLAEAGKRLDQMTVLLGRVHKNQRRVARLEHLAERCQGDQLPIRTRQLRVSELVELDCECFYYVAFRFQQILKFKLSVGYFPKGIRDVRNRLIEHPDAGNSAVTFVFGPAMPTGPVLKPKPGGAGIDRGLYVNAREALEKLKHALSVAPGYGENTGS